MTPTCTIYPFDCVDVMLHLLDERSVHCVVTSPPYFNLRNYGHDGQIGLEPTVDAYVERLVHVARAVRRVLRDDGTFWLNLGDTYAGSGGGGAQSLHKLADALAPRANPRNPTRQDNGDVEHPRRLSTGFAAKQRLMIPARVALALQADGWFIRDEIVWHKPRTTPHPVRDRTVAAHEMVYLLTKRPRYFFDWAAIEEPAKYAGETRQQSKVFRQLGEARAGVGKDAGARDGVFVTRSTRRKRSVWSISPSPYKEAHFATFPPALVEPCVLAGAPEACCSACGAPRVRSQRVETVAVEATGRRQSRRALELAQAAGLTEAHFAAIRAVGNADSGKNAVLKAESKRNTAETRRLAAEAKAALGGYFREFTHGGVALGELEPTCKCGAADAPAVVLDPFGGSGTTALVAMRHGRSAALCEINPAYVDLARQRLERGR